MYYGLVRAAARSCLDGLPADSSTVALAKSAHYAVSSRQLTCKDAFQTPTQDKAVLT